MNESLEEQHISGDESFTLVEFPGCINDMENVMRKLVFRQDSIDLHFNPKDLWRRPIKGDLSQYNGLLLKVTKEKEKEKEKGEGEEDVIKAEIVGKISKVGRFRRLADFRMPIPEETEMERDIFEITKTLNVDKLEELAKTLANEDWRAEQALERRMLAYPPPQFTPSDFPFYFAASSASGITNESGRRKGRQAAWTRYYSDISIPESSPKDVASRVRRLHRADFDKLQALFDKRPVWLRSALKHYMPNIGPTEFRAMMPAVAYFFIDGPWRCCWVRYGYDPRNNSDSKIYQVVEMRATRIQSMIDMFPLALRKAADSVPEKHVFDGLHIISNMSQFQYCDLTFPLIQNIINNRENLRDSCDKKEGWFVDGTSKRVRSLIKERWFDLVKQTDPNFYEMTTAEVSNDLPPEAADIDAVVEGDAMLAMEELEQFMTDLPELEQLMTDLPEMGYSTPPGVQGSGSELSEYEIYE